MAIKLIAIDVDGTLLDDNHHLSDVNLKAIHEATEAGIHVVIATGRARSSCVDLLRRLRLDTPGIYVHGAQISAPDGERLHGTWLDSETIDHVMHFLNKNGLSVIGFDGERILAERRDEYTDKIMEYGEPQPIIVPRLCDEPVHKLLIIAPPETVSAFRQPLEAHTAGKSVNVMVTHPELLEVAPNNVSKGWALAWVGGRLRIQPDEMMAIGNAENDIPMIQYAGVGVAVANAQTAVLAVADRVVGRHDENGVAEAIRKIAFPTTPS